MARLSEPAPLNEERPTVPMVLTGEERGKRRPLMYIGIGGLILLIILLIILF